jgi:hypothetical protein
MNSVGNWKPRQLRKLFKILKSSIIQSLIIFQALESICFAFQSSEEIEIHLKKIKLTGAHWSAAHLPFNRATRLPGPVHAHHRVSHHAVTMLTAERALVLVTAGHHRPRAVVPSHHSVHSHPRHPLCSPVPPLTAIPHRRSCQRSAPPSPHHQLEPICNSKHRLPRPPAASSSSRSAPSTTVSHRSWVKPGVPQAPRGSAIHPRANFLCRWPPVRAATVLFTAAEFLTVASLRWAPHRPTTPNQFPMDPSSSPATPCLAHHHLLAGFGQWSHGRQRGKAFPYFRFWAESPKWAGPFRNQLGQVHCRSSPSAQCHFLFSIRFNSIQIQI